jgi:DHA1 family tetracycline resistance protein-like MFS transporter
MAYVADVTEPERRAARFGLFSAMYGAGMVLGPAIGGLLGQLGPRAPFWAAAAIAFAMALYGLLVLPESLPPEKRGAVRGLNPFAPFGLLLRPGLRRLALIAAVVALAGTSANALFVLYVDYRYAWGAAEAGLLLTLFAAGNIATMGVIAPQFAKRIGEGATLLAGLVLSAIGFASLALASAPLAFALGCIPTCLGNICGPPLRALQTTYVSEQEQGRLSGALAGLNALAALAGPLAFTQFFAWSISQPGVEQPGNAMLAGAGLLALGAVLSIGVARQRAAA